MKVPKPTVCKDPEWLQVVRGMPCWCWRKSTDDQLAGFTWCCPLETIGPGPCEASHLDGKSRDDRTLPMCGGCHRTGLHAWHKGQRSFCRYFGVTKAQLIREAESLYAEYQDAQG